MSTPETKAKNPITLKIKFKSGSLDQFIERYSVDVSKGGIFIRTKEPLPVGTQLKFEFQLQDGSPLLAGEGTVVWNRTQEQAKANAAPGMGVRFDKLNADSQRTLDRILDDKQRRGEGQVESRYDAGLRAASGLPDPVSPPSQATPDQGGFGDEPTRAMAADQVNRLAEQSAMNSVVDDDKPTRSVPQPLPEEVRRAMGAASEAPKMAPMAPMAPITPIKPPAGLGKTLLGQGFGLPRGPLVPPPAGKDGPSVEIKRETSGAAPTPATSGLPESAKTPTASPDEQQARIADSARTPTGPGVAQTQPTEPVAAASAPSEPVTPPAASSGPTPMPSLTPTPPGPAISPPAELVTSQPSRPLSTPAQSGGSSKGLIIGALVLLVVLGALGYVMFVQPRMKATTETPGTTPVVTTPTPPTETKPPEPTAPTNPTATTPTPTNPTETKPPEPTEVPVKPVAAEGVEVVTEPPGAMLEVAGKQYGPTPTRVPGLDVGSRIKITLRGHADAVPRLRNKPDETKPLVFKLTAVPRLVEVLSNPKGAEVFIDGSRVGKTPLKGTPLEAGKTHEIEVKRAGFLPWKQTVTDASTFVVKNKKEVLTLNATLEAEGGKKKGGRSGGGEAAPPTESAPVEKTLPPPPSGSEPAKPVEAPKPAEPAEPKAAEPAKAEPKAAEPTKAEPKAAEPAKAPEAAAPAP
ncbi:MAG: TIGR02266 family protein [Polyangia bacterium]